MLDLTNSKHVDILKSLFHFCRPCYAHFGLPCGTCSRAREKPLPAHLKGYSAPQPLRDECHVEGLPHLSGSDRLKVETANMLYKHAVELLEICRQLNTCVSIENPLRSWLWILLATYIKATNNIQLIQWYSDLECVTFDACAHGSDRDKRTKLLTTPGFFSDLEQYCPGDHQHASWTPFQVDKRIFFPTSTEAEYPTLLCSRMAGCVMNFATSRKVDVRVDAKLKDLMRLQLGQQILKHPPLIAEFKTFVFTEKPINDSSHKLLAAPINQGQQHQEQQEGEQMRTDKGFSKRKSFKYGVWHSPKEFIDKATQLSHPVDNESFLHQATRDAIHNVVNTDSVSLAKQRLSAVYKLRKLASEMSDDEKHLRQQMHPDVHKCTKAKSITLFKRVLDQLDYWDKGVIDLMTFGIPLVGLHAAPNGYLNHLCPASMTEDELSNSALWRRRALMGSNREWTPEEEDALVKTTSEEVNMGFLEGPYSEDEMSVLLGTDKWSLNPRFVLFQGSTGKVRIIDDAKRSCVNEAYSSTIKLQLQDVDYVAAMVTEATKVAASAGMQCDWMGKTFDLSKAYKQLAVHPDHHQHAVVGFSVKGVWRFYRSLSLPFGSTGSVYGFVRISQAICFVITKLLSCVCSHYFDDFPMIEPSPGCKVLSLAVGAIFDIRGWTYAREGDKGLPFAEAFDVLGISINLKRMPEGSFTMANKQARVDKLVQMLDKVSSRGAINYAEASELQGLLNFAVGFFSGKSLKHLVSAFNPFIGDRSAQGSKSLRALCQYATTMITNLPPRCHTVSDDRKPILLFTDGAWEDGRATAGAVLLDGHRQQAFEILVPNELVSHWSQLVGEQIICQIELWALLTMVWHFRREFSGRRLICWIDNEAARACAIKANSAAPTMKVMSRILADIEMHYPNMSWYERVCSFSNPADLPSRGKLYQAAVEYGLSNGGVLEADEQLVGEIIRLADNPYQSALFNLGKTT